MSDPDKRRLHFERELTSVLNRQRQLDALPALIACLKPEPSQVDLESTAIGFDSNVFLRLGGHARSADIIDYLSSTHKAPIVLPGQAIQEFWNNQLQVVDTVTSKIRKDFDKFRKQLSNVDQNFGDYAERIGELMDKFSNEHGHVYDEGTLRNTGVLLDALQEKAVVHYASRLRFKRVARQRKFTKTPPGFKDDGDGDFFVWVDFLSGLQCARDEGHDFSRVALVSQEQKVDWSRKGVAHPILVAEVDALFGTPFEIWDLEKLAEHVSAVI